MLFLMATVKLMNNVKIEKAKKNLLADEIVGLETDFFLVSVLVSDFSYWSRFWSRIIVVSAS